MSNNYSGKKSDEGNETFLASQRKLGQAFTNRLRTGTVRVFRAVREHLFPMPLDLLSRRLVKTTVTTITTTKIVTTRARSTTTVQNITTTASTTKVATADCVKINTTPITTATTKSIVPSDTTYKISKITRTLTTTTTTTTTNINPIPKTTTSITKTKTRDSKYSLARQLYRNRRHAMTYSRH